VDAVQVLVEALHAGKRRRTRRVRDRETRGLDRHPAKRTQVAQVCCWQLAVGVDEQQLLASRVLFDRTGRNEAVERVLIEVQRPPTARMGGRLQLEGHLTKAQRSTGDDEVCQPSEAPRVNVQLRHWRTLARRRVCKDLALSPESASR